MEAKEAIRLKDGKLIIPRRYLNDLKRLQREVVENKPKILEYLLHNDARLADAFLAQTTEKLAQILFGKQNKTPSAEESLVEKTICDGKEEIRLVDGNLTFPRRYLNDLKNLQREIIENKPKILDYLLHEDAKLADAILSESTDKLAQFLFGKMNEETNSTDAEKKKNSTIAKTKYDARVRNPELRRENQRRSRLYVNVVVNGKVVKALIDTGAELSIVTSKLIEDCDLSEFVDTSYSGTVVGMGSQKITGRIHCIDIKLQKTTLPISLICVNHQMSSPFLIGLDFLWRHGAIINLREKTLSIGSELIGFYVDRVRVTDTLEQNEEEKHICKICQRHFKSAEKLLTHKNNSKMHRQNVARLHDTALGQEDEVSTKAPEEEKEEEEKEEEKEEEEKEEEEKEEEEKEEEEDGASLVSCPEGVDENEISRVLNYIMQTRIPQS